MNELIGELRELYNSSEFAKDNLSFFETLSNLAEWQGAEFDPILLPTLEESQRLAIKDAFRRAVSGYPLQYITGKAWFYKYAFFVRPGVLIPRRDSEILVEKATMLIPHASHFLDLCTGSGCLGLSVLAERPDTSATLVDISDTALEVARENARLLGVEHRCSFLKHDLLKTSVEALPEHDAIIMNPPYLTSEELSHIPENVRHEPTTALDGGEDGLEFYRLFSDTSKLLIVEMGAGQAEDMFEIFKEGELVHDLEKNPRVFIKNKDYKGEIHHGNKF